MILDRLTRRQLSKERATTTTRFISPTRVAHTTRNLGAAGRYSRLWPWRPLGLMYPPLEQFVRTVPPSSIATVTGRAGTVIFCDTTGFHRGGFATERSRMMAVFNYASPACLHSLAARNFHIAPSELRRDLPPAVRFTLG